MIVHPLHEKPASARRITAEMWFWLFSFLNEAFSMLLRSLNRAYSLGGGSIARKDMQVSPEKFLNFKGLDIWHLDKPPASWWAFSYFQHTFLSCKDLAYLKTYTVEDGRRYYLGTVWNSAFPLWRNSLIVVWWWKHTTSLQSGELGMAVCTNVPCLY